MEYDFDLNFQLRRIGKPATVAGVKDIFQLHEGITRIGRSPSNEVFLDSTNLVNFISRWHSEIHSEIENEQAKFVLKDQSVNGTYINDVKIKERAELKPGDRVCFGHPFGRNLIYGQFAPQADSEFAFVFEKEDDSQIPESDLVCVEENPIPLPAMLSPAHNMVSVKTEVSYLDSPVIPVMSSAQQPSSSQDTPGSAVNTASSAARKIFDSPSGTVVLKDISNPSIKTSPNKGLLHLDDLIYKGVLTPSKSDNHRLPLSQDEEDIFKTAINAAKLFCVSDAESEEDAFSAVSFPLSQSRTQATSLRPSAPQTSLTSSPNATRSPPALLQHLLFTPPTLPQTTPSPITAGPSSSQTTQPKGSIQKRRGRPPKKLSPVPAMNTGQVMAQPVPVAPLVQVAPPVAKPQKQKKQAKRKKCSAVTHHKKRRNAPHSAATYHPNPNEEDYDEDDPVFHYDGEKCDAYQCVQSISRQVSWVQCDDCDKWYHTACAGCTYDDVKDENSQFHCGCI